MTHDAIVIGTGQAGPSVAAALAADGKRVAITESEHLGGTCLNHGCRPTKALRASARAAHIARTAGRHGVHTDVTVDFAAVMARKDDLIGGMRQGFEDWIRNADGIEVFEGRTRFEASEDGAHRVRVGDTRLSAPLVHVDVGARAVVPPIGGLDDVAWMTEEGLLALTELPGHLIVVGGGYIGMEFAQMMRRFGSEVSVVASGGLAPREDDDVRAAVHELFTGEGIAVVEGRAERVERTDDGLAVHAGGTRVEGTHLLIAVGRRPNSDLLEAEAAGLALDDRGYLVTDGRLATNVEGIYALGDVNGRGAFTHTAYMDGTVAAANLGGGDRTVEGRIPVSATFIDPPLGRVGMDERQARDHDGRVLVGRLPMSSVSRAQLEGETAGLMKVLVDADTEQFLGATAFGMQGDDVVQVVGALMHAGTPYPVLRDALPIHPSISEFWPTILGALEPLDG